MSSEEQKVEKVVAEEVIDVILNPEVIQKWYYEAGEVQNFEGLQKLSERLLSDVRYTRATTPRAFAVIALAALKLANESRHGPLEDDQWEMVIDTLKMAMMGG